MRLHCSQTHDLFTLFGMEKMQRRVASPPLFIPTFCIKKTSAVSIFEIRTESSNLARIRILMQTKKIKKSPIFIHLPTGFAPRLLQIHIQRLGFFWHKKFRGPKGFIKKRKTYG
uniref:Uncharacterized protein n=1 Tax=Cacopsylla melanoneura TaxID=428564 RepID=A0A8D9BS12_9HEMI